MALIDVVNSWVGPLAGVAIGKILPQSQAYKLADRITRYISRDPESEVMHALRYNQQMVQGGDLSESELIHAARQVMHNVGRGYADWYKAITTPTEELLERCVIDDLIFDVIEQSQQDQRGLVFVGPHMSSFNMFLMGLGIRNVKGQVLSYAQPGASYKVDNAIRRRFGLEITPISIASLRQALARLRQGGFVLTAVDRPDVGGERMTFFHKNVLLPIGHARLAVKTGARMLVGTCQLMSEGHYYVKAVPLEVHPDTNENKTAIELAQRALHILEGYIQERPEEWMMFLPIREMPAGSQA